MDEYAPDKPRRRLAVFALSVALLALAGGVGYFAKASSDNRDAASAWRARAQASDKLLRARTHQLNERSRSLNRTVKALSRSERDVARLEKRQRALADEKAQVEDQRGAMLVQTSQLARLADDQRVCSDGLARLLSAFAEEDFVTVELEAATVDEDCRRARESFAVFQARYGTG